MKFYLTADPISKLMNIFVNLNKFYIIDVDTLLSQTTFDFDNPVHTYIINTELARLIRNGVKSKTVLGVIYINKNMTSDMIKSVKQQVEEADSNSVIEEFVLLDDYTVPTLSKYYKLFDEIIFYPTFGKTKIIECKPVQPATAKRKIKKSLAAD